MNDSFADFISEYTINPKAIEPLLFEMKHQYHKLSENSIDEKKNIKTSLMSVQKKIDSIYDDYYYIKKIMPLEKYNNFLERFSKEKQELLECFKQTHSVCSNFEKYFSAAITMSSKINKIWASDSIKDKENFQKLLFPEGVIYNYKKGHFELKK